jgi:ribosomal protein S18 acetylase RimI-like enzyme
MGEDATVKVRQATPEDLPALVTLFQELDRLQRDWRVFTPRSGFYDEVETKFRAAMEPSRDAVVLVAEHEGEIVGMGYGEAHVPSRFSDERALEVSGVIVRSGHRGQGVGRALMREAARFAAERDIPWVELKTYAPNRAAMTFWEDLGFKPRVVQMTSASRTLLRRLEDELDG